MCSISANWVNSIVRVYELRLTGSFYVYRIADGMSTNETSSNSSTKIRAGNYNGILRQPKIRTCE